MEQELKKNALNAKARINFFIVTSFSSTKKTNAYFAKFSKKYGIVSIPL